MKEKITDQKESIKQKSYSESEPDECLLDRRHKINVRFLNVLLVFDQLPMPMLSALHDEPIHNKAYADM